ncbi:MAG: glycosyltransferase family A protein [Bacteroidia bacterium]
MTELVSVIIPVYNAAEFVKASVESILSQSYHEIEIIIVNDGSTDGSAEKLNSFSDPRIKLFHIQNGGVANALNAALLHATGKYIARQDADDISTPDRIKLLVGFMQAHPQYGLVGGAAKIIDAAGSPKGAISHATSNTKLQYDLLWDSPFVSSATLFRKECLDMTGNFQTGKDLFEDYDMWSKIALYYKIANLPAILLQYRELSTGLSFTTSNSNDRIINQRRKNIAARFPSLEKEIVDGLALSGTARTRISSLAQLKRVYKMIIAHFESEGATTEELAAIRKDLAERMNAFRWMTGENKNALYYPGRILEKLFYPKK